MLRYSAAFFFVLVAIFLAYALFKAAKTLERLDKVLADVDENGIPLMQKAGETLDGVNANLDNVDEITKDVAGITDKIDTMANAVESAVSTPARKAAAFSAGVQSAVSSFMRKRQAGHRRQHRPVRRARQRAGLRLDVRARRRRPTAARRGRRRRRPSPRPLRDRGRRGREGRVTPSWRSWRPSSTRARQARRPTPGDA